MTGRRAVRAAVVLALLVPVVAFFGEAASARIVAADAGFAVSPAGSVRMDPHDEELKLVYPFGTAPDITVRLRVRNTGRFAATVTYPADLTFAGEDRWPTRRARVPGRGTAWLEFNLGSGGCVVASVAKSSTRMTQGYLPVTVHRPGRTREESVALPMGLDVPSFEVVPCDPPGSAP